VLLSAEICHDGSEDGVNFLRKLVNKQTLHDLMGCMPLVLWKRWTQERPSWMHEDMEEAFWQFVVIFAACGSG
jgi:hypothetical protein